jgi:glycosyltransferase involved in cell wall biosynthesis
VITASEPVRREVCEHLGLAPEKVIAIPLAPQPEFAPMPAEVTAEVRQRLGVEAEFVLYAGTVEPRKNLITLLRAFADVLRTTSLRPQLVIAGKLGWKENDALTDIEKSAFKDRIKMTGYVTDADLCALYSSCSVFCLSIGLRRFWFAAIGGDDVWRAGDRKCSSECDERCCESDHADGRSGISTPPRRATHGCEGARGGFQRQG